MYFVRLKSYWQNVKAVCLCGQKLFLLLEANFTALHFYFSETCRTMSLACAWIPIFDSTVACTASCWRWYCQPNREKQTYSSPRHTTDYLCWFGFPQVWRHHWWSGWGSVQWWVQFRKLSPLKASVVNFGRAEIPVLLLHIFIFLQYSLSFLLAWLTATNLQPDE